MTTLTPIKQRDDIAIFHVTEGNALSSLFATLPSPEPRRYATAPFNLNDPKITRYPEGPTDPHAFISNDGADEVYAVTVHDTLAALIIHEKKTNCLFSIHTFGAPLRAHPHFAFIHFAYMILIDHLDADIALDPSGPHHPYLVSRYGRHLPPDPAYAADAAYGTVALPADTTHDMLDLALSRENLTVDVSLLPQHMLDTIRTAKGAIYSTARHVLLRHLRTAGHIVLPCADMVMLPALCEVNGVFVARAATYVDARHLEAIDAMLALHKMQFADFPALTAAIGDIHLPMARNAAFPALRRMDGEFHVPRRAKVFAPRLAEVKRSHTNAPMQMMEEMELCTDSNPKHLVFLNLTA